MVALIETLIGKGLQLAIYDKDVSLARLFGANKEYIEREIPHISKLMRNDLKEVIDEAEVIVVGNRSPEFREIEKMRRDGQKIIDLVRLFEEKRSGDWYEGICW